MNARDTFTRLVGEASDAGLLKFCKDGVAVIILPPHADEKEERSESVEPVSGQDRVEGREVRDREIEGPDKHTGPQGCFDTLGESKAG